MEAVAIHLKNHAIGLQGAVDADLFGRSSFNRYYYSAYLSVRRELEAYEKSAQTKHAGMPDYIEGEIVRRLKAIKSQARRVNDYPLMQNCSAAVEAARALAALLRQGYKVRTVADYMPGTRVDFQSDVNGFSLDSVSIADAQSWPSRSRVLMATIISTLRNGNA